MLIQQKIPAPLALVGGPKQSQNWDIEFPCLIRHPREGIRPLHIDFYKLPFSELTVNINVTKSFLSSCHHSNYKKIINLMTEKLQTVIRLSKM